MNVLSPAENDAISKLAYENNLLSMYLAFSASCSTLGFTAAAGGWRSVKAAQTYIIVGVHLDGQIFAATTNDRSLVAITWSSAHNHLVSKVRGDVVAGHMFVKDSKADFNWGGRGPVWEKDRTLYFHAHTDTTNGTLACNAELFLQPIYKD